MADQLGRYKRGCAGSGEWKLNTSFCVDNHGVLAFFAAAHDDRRGARVGSGNRM